MTWPQLLSSEIAGERSRDSNVSSTSGSSGQPTATNGQVARSQAECGNTTQATPINNLDLGEGNLRVDSTPFSNYPHDDVNGTQ